MSLGSTEWEQLRALNMPERSSMDLNETAQTCRGLIFAGQRGPRDIVHTEEANADINHSGRAAA